MIRPDPPLLPPKIMLTLAVLFWAGNTVIGKASVGLVPPMALSFWRWTLALLFLLPFAWRDLVAAAPVARRRWRSMVVLSALSVTAFNTLLYLSVQYTAAVNAALLNAALPVVVVTLSWILYRLPVGGREALGIALSIFGVIAIVAQGDLAALVGLTPNPGDMIMLVAVVCWAVYSVLLQRHRPAELGEKGFLIWTIVIGLPLIAPFYLWELAQGAEIVVRPASYAAIAYTGVFPSILSYILWNSGVAHAGAKVAGIVYNFLPGFAAIGAIVFLGEALHLFHVAGIALIFAGVWLATRRQG